MTRRSFAGVPRQIKTRLGRVRLADETRPHRARERRSAPAARTSCLPKGDHRGAGAGFPAPRGARPRPRPRRAAVICRRGRCPRGFARGQASAPARRSQAASPSVPENGRAFALLEAPLFRPAGGVDQPQPWGSPTQRWGSCTLRVRLTRPTAGVSNLTAGASDPTPEVHQPHGWGWQVHRWGCGGGPRPGLLNPTAEVRRSTVRVSNPSREGEEPQR